MPERRRLFEVAREKIRNRHLALRTEQAYLYWMRRYIKFHARRHPREMGRAEVGHRVVLAGQRHEGVAIEADFGGAEPRVKDLVWDRGEVIVRSAKGGKDRVTVLPATCVEAPTQWGW